MSTLPDRDQTALLVIDVQNGVVAEAFERDAVVANIAVLVERARATDTPVIWVQHTDEDLPVGSEEWLYVSELVRETQEPLIQKEYGDAFEETELEALLDELGVGRLVVVGAQTDQCIRCTLHGAMVRGYDTTLVRDAHTTVDNSSYGAPAPDEVIAHTNFYWEYQTAPGRSCGTADTVDLEFDD